LARDDERLMADPHFEAEIGEDETGMVKALIERHGPEKVAAALMRLHRAGRSAPEELIENGPVTAPGGTYPERAPREHVALQNAVWFSLSIGRKQSAEPRWLLPMLCRAGHITKAEIGSIRILTSRPMWRFQAIQRQSSRRPSALPAQDREKHHGNQARGSAAGSSAQAAPCQIQKAWQSYRHRGERVEDAPRMRAGP
jgi:hypothetical protein